MFLPSVIEKRLRAWPEERADLRVAEAPDVVDGTHEGGRIEVRSAVGIGEISVADGIRPLCGGETADGACRFQTDRRC